MADSEETSADRNVEIWRVKRLIKKLTTARGNGTSMISLVMPPKDQIARVSKMLADEYGTASNIKSRVNRLSVLSAITSVQQRLKLYNRMPTNGLVIYCGTILTDEGKEKKVNIDFEPFKAINTSLYLCDNKFHTEALQELLTDDNKFGFIIMDGNGCLFGTLQGNTRDILHKFSVELPKKHGRGGQSAVRFARLREEKRHNYVRKVAETSTQMFITGDKINVQGLILAGSADFKTNLNQSDLFDNRLACKVLTTVDISYGGENGFNQAIELAQETLSNVKFVQEKKLLMKYFDEITRNDGVEAGKYCFGTSDTMNALESGAVDILIVWENLDLTRYAFRNPNPDSSDIIKYLDGRGERDRKNFIDEQTGAELEQIENGPLLEYLANKYKEFGATLEIVTDRSQEGAQFVRGFGGIGGILRYAVNFGNFEVEEFDDDDFDLDDY
jgi:peptide chain release factor subunit 1